MIPKHRYAAMAVTLLLAIGGFSCGSDTNSAVQPPITPSPVPATTGPTVVRIDLTVPSSIAPGEEVQLTATAVKSDSSVEDVTASVAWSASPNLLELTSTGVLKGKSIG